MCADAIAAPPSLLSRKHLARLRLAASREHRSPWTPHWTPGTVGSKAGEVFTVLYGTRQVSLTLSRPPFSWEFQRFQATSDAPRRSMPSTGRGLSYQRASTSANGTDGGRGQRRAPLITSLHGQGRWQEVTAAKASRRAVASASSACSCKPS